MNSKEHTLPLPEMAETSRRVKSFKTSKGSIYTYGPDGRTMRFKTAASARGEQAQYTPQDITVFVHLNPEAEQRYLDALHAHTDDPAKKKKVYVVEPLPDGSPRIVRHISDAIDPNNLYLAALQNGQVVGSTKASIEPEIGAHVFDTRHYEENGQWFTERHLGHPVVEIVRSD
jgi:hypothetical protein